MNKTSRSSPFASDRDRQQLDRLGIPVAEAERQLAILQQSSTAVELARPCTLRDGILQLDASDQSRCLNLWSQLQAERRLAKFVPASGAATRMFKELGPLLRVDSPRALEGNPELANTAERFCGSIRQFAFFPLLEETVRSQGESVDRLIARRDMATLVGALLDRHGLGYRTLPKGLIPFHSYPEELRSAAVEHMWEGAGYLTEPGDVGRLHFTVAGKRLAGFESGIEDALRAVHKELDIDFEVDFSTQDSVTDTLAVDSNNQVVRRTDGSLLLRPAGHGALIDNLAAIDADVVYIKNIDNVAHRRLHPITVRWKRILGGYFFHLQREIFELLERLQSGEDPTPLMHRAEVLVTTRLSTDIGSMERGQGVERQRQQWIEILDRPLRVCGVVENTSEPGGGPFWLESQGGICRAQIVEGAQVDLTDTDQAECWRSSTHFNPVDLVCGLRDHRGRPFQLEAFIDPASSIVTHKTFRGRPLKAMERPGLWNGAMAWWNTAFVEVPLQTFTPVKTVFDLLRPEHQG